MELSHGPIRERFPIRLPPKHNVVDQCIQIDASIVTPRCVAGSHIEDDNHGHTCFKGPAWLQMTVAENGAQVLAEMYEVSKPCFVRFTALDYLLTSFMSAEIRASGAEKTAKYHAFSFEACR